MYRSGPVLFLMLISLAEISPMSAVTPSSSCLSCHPRMLSPKGEPAHPGMRDCISCHPDEGKGCPNSPPAGIPGRKLCLSCHKIGKLRELHHGQISGRSSCGACHDAHGTGLKHLLRRDFQHAPFASGDCAACHRKPFDGHIRLRSRKNRLCSSCHPEITRSRGKRLHPALDPSKNRQTCLACHDPHMGNTRGLLRDSVVGLCRKCHPQIVEEARSEFGHKPAADNCGCHPPHGSGIQGLLKKEIPFLCLNCHSPDDETLRKTHLGAPMKTLDCLECHTPHGASHPGLPAPEIHAVMLQGCSECHEGSYDRIVGGKDSSCLKCHDDIVRTAENSPFYHPAVNMISCITCHTPHASANAHLLREGGGRVCFECHPKIEPAPGEITHGIIPISGCGACHAPHGAEHSHLLRDNSDKLCLGCHDARNAPGRDTQGKILFLDRIEIPAETARRMAVLRLSADGTRNHPVADHRVIGKPSPEEIRRNDAQFFGELHCISCHNPHKGKSRQLLRWNASGAFEACSNCHEK